jgi:hypothetical protein
MVAVTKTGRNITPAEVEQIQRSKRFEKGTFYPISDLRGYLNTKDGWHNYIWGRIKEGEKPKKTESGGWQIEIQQNSNWNESGSIIDREKRFIQMGSDLRNFANPPRPKQKKIMGMPVEDFMNLILSGPVETEQFGTTLGRNAERVGTKLLQDIKQELKELEETGLISKEENNYIEASIVKGDPVPSVKPTADPENQASLYIQEDFMRTMIEKYPKDSPEGLWYRDRLQNIKTKININENSIKPEELDDVAKIFEARAKEVGETNPELKQFLNTKAQGYRGLAKGQVIAKTALEESREALRAEKELLPTEGEGMENIPTDAEMRKEFGRKFGRNPDNNEATWNNFRVKKYQDFQKFTTQFKRLSPLYKQTYALLEGDKEALNLLEGLGSQPTKEAIDNVDNLIGTKIDSKIKENLDSIPEGLRPSEDTFKTEYTRKTGKLPSENVRDYKSYKVRASTAIIEAARSITKEQAEKVDDKILEEINKEFAKEILGPTEEIPVPTATDEFFEDIEEEETVEEVSVQDFKYDIETQPEIRNKDVSQLLNLTLQASTDVYKENIIGDEDYYLISDYSVPVLFENVEGNLIVSFRGTASISNILTDLNSSNILSDAENEIGTYDLFKDRMENMGVKAHQGFIKVLTESRLPKRLTDDSYVGARQSIPLYEVIREEIDKYKGTVNTVILTGHSLGGAIATLFYFLYQTDNSRKDDKIEMRVISYGSPRVFYTESIPAVESVCSNIIRVFNSRDIVTYIPFHSGMRLSNIVSGYSHIGKPLCLDDVQNTNNMNILVKHILSTDKPTTTAMKDSTTQEASELLKNVSLTKEYQELILGSVLDNMMTYEVKEEYGDPEILAMENMILDSIEPTDNWEAMVDQVKGLGITELLSLNPVGETNEQQKYTIGSVFGYVLGFNKLTAKEHKLTKYRDNLETAILIELENEEDILTGKATEVKTFEDVVTEAEIEGQVEFELTAKEAPDNIIGFT